MPKRKMPTELSSDTRNRLLDFLIQCAHHLQVRPIVKYSALSLFADRFLRRSLSTSTHNRRGGNWLLHPVTESNLQLFALISIWVATKIHDSRPLPVKTLKSLSDKAIKDQHFTIRDFLEAEVVLLQVLDYEIGTSNTAFISLEELVINLRGVARVGEYLKFEACLDIMDLLYENEETSILYGNPRSLAASVLVASYVVTVPKQTWEFPILAWVQFVTGCQEEEIVEIVREILQHVFGPSSVKCR